MVEEFRFLIYASSLFLYLSNMLIHNIMCSLSFSKETMRRGKFVFFIFLRNKGSSMIDYLFFCRGHKNFLHFTSEFVSSSVLSGAKCVAKCVFFFYYTQKPFASTVLHK